MPEILCTSCGRLHSEIQTSFAADFPDPYANLSRDDREIRAVISSDQCIIDGTDFYLRGCLEIPVGGEGVFMWGLWARVHERDFDTIHRYWNTPGREELIGPFKGRLANSLALYPETLSLPLTVQIESVGTRPLFFIDDAEHPLSIEQRDGISLEKAGEYVCLLMRMCK